MSRRIEIELTSARGDGTWTWRAAGAREPKGTLDAGLLFDGAKVGDVVRVDADFDVEGITIITVLPPRGARTEPERLEILGSGPEPEPVTTNLVERRGGRKGEGRRGDKRRGGRRGDGRTDATKRGSRDGRTDATKRGSRDGTDRDRRARPTRAEAPKKPKAPRLKPRREHREAVLAELAPEQRPVAEQVLRGGLPAVRQAVEKQNEEARAAAKPEVKAEPIVALAEELLPRLREAEWRDRADAALAGVAEVDLRDLRSVVVAADASARRSEARAQADELRASLAARVEREHAAWMAELAGALHDGRIVRALRLSSRPPKAGAPLPPDLASRLAAGASGAMTAETSSDRYGTVVEALAFSPVREQAAPLGIPDPPSDDLMATVRKSASRIPQVAAAFGVSTPQSDATRPSKSTPPVPPPPAPVDAAPAAPSPTDART